MVLIRVLADNDDLHTQSGHIAVGWLVVEDLFTVLALVLLPAVFGAGATSAGGVIAAIGVAFVKVAAMVGLTFVVGERVIPWLLDKVAATRSRELFTLTVLVVALGIAVTALVLLAASALRQRDQDGRFAEGGEFRDRARAGSPNDEIGHCVNIAQFLADELGDVVALLQAIGPR